MRFLWRGRSGLRPHESRRLSATPSKPFWASYILYDYSFGEFAAGTRVADVGCGRGDQLEQAVGRGCRAVGVELDGEAVAACAKRGLAVVQARAEELPFRTASLDGLICKVVLPYTDEARALSELTRILAPHGIACVCSHGPGYYLRYFISAP